MATHGVAACPLTVTFTASNHQLVVRALVCAAVLLQSWRAAAASSSSWDHCPDQCQCNATQLSVHCTNTNTSNNSSLTQVPDDLPLPVRYLSLRGHAITHVGPGDLANLTQLRSLDLSSNAIHNISRDAFTHTRGLETLLLSTNLLELVPVSVFQMPGLLTLDLRHNNISQLDELPPAAPSGSSNSSLAYLDLSFNHLTEVPESFLASLPGLQRLDLQANHLTALWSSSFRVFSDNETQTHPLESLNLTSNHISVIEQDALDSLSFLQSLDLSHNDLHTANVEWFQMLASLEYLSLSHNPLSFMPNNLFVNATSLQILDLSNLRNTSYVSHHTLAGLSSLQQLNLSRTPNLKFIHAQAFHDLHQLRDLDLSRCNLQWLHPITFQNLTDLQRVNLGHNPWSCDCEARWLGQWEVEAVKQGLLPGGADDRLICSSPAWLRGRPLQDVPPHNLTCEGPVVLNHTDMALAALGSAVVLDCVVAGHPRPAITWRTSKGDLLHYRPAFVDFSDLDPEHVRYHGDHEWHQMDGYMHDLVTHFDERIHVLTNGSLYIDYVMRRDGGNFTCFAHNEFGNDTVKVLVRLDYRHMWLVQVTSIIFGFICAFTFFVLTVVTSALRFVCFYFGEKETKRRRGIREVLETIHNYKSSKVEQLSAYKQAKMGQLSAFKTATIDHLNAFKVAKVENLKAYKSAKIGKIRTYKQATVTNVLHHMQNMREYYTSQMCRIKDNCSQQVEKLRDNYSGQVSRFKDYKTQHVDKIRDNYQNQAVRIRDYSSQQMARLREQYKTQQLHILKLLELLDVGNCMTVIEAECMRTESMIFDPDITFDLDTHPAHLTRGLEESGDSEYMTAGTNSDMSSVASAPYILSMHSEPPKGGGEDSSGPESGPSQPQEPPRVRKKKRHKRRPVAGLAVDRSNDSLADMGPAAGGSQRPPHAAKSCPPPPSLSLSPSRRRGCERCELCEREATPGQESVTSADYASAQASRDHSPEEAIAGGSNSNTSPPPPTQDGDQPAGTATTSPDHVVVHMGAHDVQLTDGNTIITATEQQAKETTV